MTGRRPPGPPPTTAGSSWWVLLAVLVATLAGGAAGCSSATEDPSADPAGAYAVAIEWLVDRSVPDVEHPTVFVEPQGEGFGINLELQAGIVKATEEYAEVRFVDDRSEAVDEDGVVRDEGVLLAIGPALEEDGITVVAVGAGRSDDAVAQWRFELRHHDDTWSLASEPAEQEA